MHNSSIETNQRKETTYNPETEITTTAGPIQAIMTAISTTIREDDEVILFEPAYESYAPAISINGGRPVYVSLKQPNTIS